jgi:long-chain acyl-CoA synthetase
LAVSRPINSLTPTRHSAKGVESLAYQRMMISLEKVWSKHWPKCVPQSIDYPDISLGQMLKASTEKAPNSTAIFFQNNQITYEELNGFVSSFGEALRRLGIDKGDRVAIYLPNSPQFVIAYFGALRVGAIVVACSPLYKEKELVHILANSESRVIVYLDKLDPYVQLVKGKTRLEQLIKTSLDEFGIHRKETKVKPAASSNLNMKQLLESRTGKLVIPTLNPKEDVALFQYTGGTTGTPKAAMLTHRNLVVNAVQFASWLYMRDQVEVNLSVLPFFHIYGITAALNSPIYTSSKMILIPDPRDTNSLVEAIDRYEPTIFCGVPLSYISLMNFPKIQQHKIRSIRTCISGASPLPQEIQRRFEELTGGRLVEGYGLTEASPVTHVNPLDEPEKNRPGSIGIPISDTICRIVDAENGTNELPPFETGELVIKGPQVMSGYWKMPEETKLALKEGWLFTGDIAVMDDDGYFRLVDRKKDMINVSGFKVWPREVEEVLYEHPAIKEAAAVATSDSESGEKVKVFVVLNDNFRGKISDSEIIAFCNERLANYKVPKIVEIRESLPKTPVGKIMRSELKLSSETK